MTTVCIWKKGNIVKAFEASGHAGFARFGKDIVCSAISTLMINSINSIETFTNDEIDVVSDDKTGLIRCVFKNEPSSDSQLLVNSLILGLKQIQDEYGNKFIDINYEEV